MSCNDWKEYSLSELIDIKHGYAFKGKFFCEEETDLILLTPGNFKIGGGFQSKKFKYYSKDGEIPEQYILNKNDVLVTMTDLSKSGDTLGYPAKVPSIKNKILLHNQRLGKVNIKNEKLVNKDFIYYLMCSSKYRNEVLASATGTTVRHTAPDRILKFKLKLPSLEEQEKIANILSSLDDKIELNNDMNKTLEEMAQSIFKRWFVDFEFPNDDGEPYKSSGGEMVESELGMIPKGWEVGTLNDISIFKNGKSIKKELRNENGVNLIYGSNGIIGQTNEVLQEGDCIIIGRVGAYCGSVQLSLKSCWVTDNAIICTGNEKEYLPYLYRLLLNYPLRESAGGSAQPLINQSILKDIKIVIPPKILIKTFYNIVSETINAVNLNQEENKSLGDLRDSILSKLMSGDIRVK